MSTTQDYKMAAVLIRLELVSFGSCQAWNASGGHSGEPDDKMVSMVIRSEDPPHLVWRMRYEEQHSDDGRDRIIEKARAEVDSWTVGPDTTERASKSVDELVIEDGEGWEPRIVAERYGLDPHHVRRIRQRAGKATEDGRKIEPAATPDMLERQRRARELRNKGLSLRQIAMHLDCGVATVSRALAA